MADDALDEGSDDPLAWLQPGHRAAPAEALKRIQALCAAWPDLHAAMFVVLALVGLVAFPTIGGGLMAALAFGGVTFLEGHFVTPTIIGRRLSLNALAVFIALAFWTWLWGPMGAFLSSPLLIVGLILKEHLLPADSPQLPQG